MGGVAFIHPSIGQIPHCSPLIGLPGAGLELRCTVSVITLSLKLFTSYILRVKMVTLRSSVGVSPTGKIIKFQKQ